MMGDRAPEFAGFNGLGEKPLHAMPLAFQANLIGVVGG
jgi:hypothetical protein